MAPSGYDGATVWIRVHSILAFIFCLLALGHAQKQPYLTVVASRTLRPNSAYHVAVSYQATGTGRGSANVRVTIEGQQAGAGPFTTSQSITVEPYQTRVVKLEIGEIGPGTYNLTAFGDGGNFRETKQLEYVPKSYSVFIQTDKAIYKPGHVIHFRCIVLDSRLRPGVSGTIDVHVTDGKGNRVKQWPRALTAKGVFSAELPLSNSPVLGDWNITVVALGQTFSRSVHVAEYVLPKFQITVEAPQHATFDEGRLPVTVRAKYTHDTKVKGEVTVSAYPLFYSGVLQPIFQAPVRHVLPIDGEVTLDLDITKELRLAEEYQRIVVIEAIVEESLTGRRQNGTSQITIHKYPYRLELLKSAEYYKPGLNYTAKIAVFRHDKAPVKGSVLVRHGFSYDSDSYTENKYELDVHGIVDLNFITPAQNHSVLVIEAQYLDRKEWFSAVAAATSPEGVFVKTTLLTEEPVVNSYIEIKVESSAPLMYLSYQVFGRGDVLQTGIVRVERNSATTFRFMALPAMSPTAHLVTHFVTDTGELVADALDIDISGSLQNFVNVSTSVTETSPGKDVELTIEAKPNSYIGLLGIDQSVLILRDGNDISLGQVENELRSYDGAQPSPYRMLNGIDVDLSPLRIWKPGSSTADDVFNDIGAVVLTNANVPKNFPIRPTDRPDGVAPGATTAKPDRGPAISLGSATRPPLAGPYAFSRIPRPRVLWNQPRVFLTKPRLPEATWLFVNVSSGIDGKTSLRRSVPDTITSWVISAFSIDPVWGLGLISAPKKLRVFQPFFVSLDLPYSVRRGEIISISIIVHNYLNQDLSTEVTLDNTDQSFEFAEVSNEIQENSPKVELYRRKKINVAKNNAASISFMITPRQLGYIPIKVTATSLLASDTVQRKLLVVAEGETQYRNKAIFVDLRRSPIFKTNITLDIPKNIVVDSEFVEVSAVGDILGPSIPNLENLIQLPHGCGEQNMLNFVPNIVVIEYLKNTNQLTPAVQDKAVKYMETGYQQELTYQRSDGSFSAFGQSDPSGSVWLTAFVARSFRQASPHISIEEVVIDKALRWLAAQQAPNGSFPEVGKVIHRDMQGGGADGLALTAYSLIAFLESFPPNGGQYANTVSRALDYIAKNLNGLSDVYATAVCSYALQLAKHPSKATALNLLESMSKSSSEMKWWAKDEIKDDNNPWKNVPNSLNIEISSYAMLALIQAGLIEDCLPVMRWLVNQRNQQGGFSSTQDTVIGLQALAKLAENLSKDSGGSMLIMYEYKKGTIGQINVNSQNNLILQKYEVPKKTRMLNISAEGSGFAIVQVSYRFNVNVTGPSPMFTLDPQVDRNSNRNHLQLSICSGFIGNQDNNNNVSYDSNMAVMEVALPSGYTADSDALPSLRASPHVKRVETRNSDTVVVLYFDHMSRSHEYCPTVSAFRTHKVAKQRPVPVTVYDYYDTSRRARVFYEPRTATLCDICEGEDCGNVCSNNPDTQQSSETKDSDGGGAAALQPALLLLLLTFLHFAVHNLK